MLLFIFLPAELCTRFIGRDFESVWKQAVHAHHTGTLPAGTCDGVWGLPRGALYCCCRGCATWVCHASGMQTTLKATNSHNAAWALPDKSAIVPAPSGTRKARP